MSKMSPTRHSPGAVKGGLLPTDSGEEHSTAKANAGRPSRLANSIAEEHKRYAEIARALEPRMRTALQHQLYGDPPKDRYITKPVNKQGVVFEDSEYQILSRLTHSAKYLAARWEQIHLGFVALHGEGYGPSADQETPMKPELDVIAAQSGDLTRDLRHFIPKWSDREASRALYDEIRSLIVI